MILPFYHITIAYISHNISYYTTSTAQGGGGSFKNRKPIGEVSCWDAWMAEQTHWWTTGGWGRESLSLSLHRSLHLSLHLSLSLSFFPLCHFCPSIYLSIHPSIYPSNIQNAAILRLRHVLRATTACTFSTSQLPTVPQAWCALYVLTSKLLRATTACNFFISLIWPDGSAPAALTSLLFDPLQPQIIGKTPWTATFLPFRALASSFLRLFLFPDLLSSFLFSDSSHLLFICPYCRKCDF